MVSISPDRVYGPRLSGQLSPGANAGTATVATSTPSISKDAVLVRPDGSTVWVALPKDEELIQEPRAGQDDHLTAKFPDELKLSAAEVRPVPVVISARLSNEYAIEPETDGGRRLLTAGTSVVIEGAERLTPGQQVRVVDLNGDADEVADTHTPGHDVHRPTANSNEMPKTRS